MKIASLLKDLEFNESRPSVQVLFETSSSKEIRIALKNNQLMKEHKTPFPIVVEIFEGKVLFGVDGVKKELVKGDMLSLDGNVPHDLLGQQDSIIRLTISKSDTADRVKQVANDSE